jgi:hypothetical protein
VLVCVGQVGRALSEASKWVEQKVNSEVTLEVGKFFRRQWASGFRELNSRSRTSITSLDYHGHDST